MTINLGMFRSTSAGAKPCSRAYEEPQTGQWHELPIRRTRVREQSQSVLGEMLHTCVSYILFWRHWNCNRRTARASFRFTLTLGPFFPIPWLACFQLSHVSTRPHASHFSASGAAAGPRAGHPRGHRCNCNTPRGDHHPLLCSSRPTGHHPPSVCTCTVPHPSPSLLSWMNHLPGSGERVHGPSDQVTKVTEGGRGWERYCTWAQRRAALPRRGRAQRSFGANKGRISAHACLFSTLCVGGLDIAHGWRWEEKEKVTFSVGRGYFGLVGTSGLDTAPDQHGHGPKYPCRAALLAQ